MRHLSTLALFAILIGFGHFAMANGGPAPLLQVKKNVNSCSARDAQTQGQKGKPKQDTAATAEVAETEEAIPKVKEALPAPPAAGKTPTEVKEGSGGKKESTSLTFNFLYYIFYKFSVSDFFQTPSYNETPGL